MKNISNRIFIVVDRYELNFGGDMDDRCVQLAVGGADIHGTSGMIGFDSTTGRWLIGEKNGVREISEEEAFNQLVKAYKDSYTVEDLVRANMEAIKRGWRNNGR